MSFSLAELVSILLNIIAPVMAVAAIGYALARIFSLDTRVLSKLSLYFFSPALTFVSIYHSKLGTEFLSILAFSLIIFVLMGIVTWVLTKSLHFDRLTESAFALCTMFINAGNFGLPLDLFAFGQEGLNRAVIFFVGTSITTQTVAVFIAARGTVTNRAAFLQVLKMPLIYAAALALLFNASQWAIPDPIMKSVELISGGTIPLVLVILGIELSRATLTQDRGTIALATAVRLIVAPILAFGVAAVMGMDGIARSVCIVESSTPTAVLAAIIASEFKVKSEFVTSTVLVTTVVSVVTLTILIGILK